MSLGKGSNTLLVALHIDRRKFPDTCPFETVLIQSLPQQRLYLLRCRAAHTAHTDNKRAWPEDDIHGGGLKGQGAVGDDQPGGDRCG